MRALIAGLCLLATVASASAAPTSSRGAYAILSLSEDEASLEVAETSDVTGGTATSQGSLSLSVDGEDEVLACSWSMPDDPVILGSARLEAECGAYDVVVSFTVVGGGTGTFAIPCSADFSRATRANVRVSRDGATVLSGITEQARVWRRVDSGTCAPD